MIAAGGKPLRISGNASFALLDPSVRSQRIARPKPKPEASPCPSAIVIKADARNSRFNSIRRDTSRWMDTASLPARSRPVQKTSPSARMRKTRAAGMVASLRSAAIIASNIGPVTSLPASALLSVKVRTAPDRSIMTGCGKGALRKSPPVVQLSVLAVYSVFTEYRNVNDLCNERHAGGRNRRSAGPGARCHRPQILRADAHGRCIQRLAQRRRGGACSPGSDRGRGTGAGKPALGGGVGEAVERQSHADARGVRATRTRGAGDGCGAGGRVRTPGAAP